MAAKKKKVLKKVHKKVKKSVKLLKKRQKKLNLQNVAVEEQYMSRLKFSKLLGIAYSTLQHAIKTGKVQVVTRNGKQVINANTEREAYVQSRKGKYKTNLKISKQDEHGVMLHIGEANLRTSVYKSKTAEMEYYQRLEHLVPVVRVNSVWQNIAKDLQKSIMAIPARIGPLMAGITDPYEAAQQLPSPPPWEA